MSGILRITNYAKAQPDGQNQVLARLIEGKIIPTKEEFLTLQCQLVAGNTKLLELSIVFSSFPSGPYPSDLEGNYIFYTNQPIVEEYRRFLGPGLYLQFS